MRPCLPFTGFVDERGYGKIGGEWAHRRAYREAHGSIPDGLEVHHTCDRRDCIEPTHLIALTHAEHMALHAAKQVRCIHGHRFTPGNTIVRRNGTRRCRECQNARHRAMRARRKAAA